MEKRGKLVARPISAKIYEMAITTRSRVRSFRGCDVHWEEWPARRPWVDEGKRPVVLVHGLSDTSQTWSKLAPALACDRRVYALDLPGHGRSARPDASYDASWYTDIVSEWIRSLGLEEFDLVGHSFGGGLSMKVMTELPGRVRRLALIAPAGLGLEVALPLRIAAVTRVLKFAAPLLMGVGTHAGVLVLGGNFDAAARRHLAEMNARPGTARALSRTLRSGVDLTGQLEHLMDYVPRIKELPPIAVYWGESDPVIPVRHADDLGRYLHGVSVRRFAKVRHHPHREATAALVPDLLAFLDGQPPTPRLRDGVLSPRASQQTASDAPRAKPVGAVAGLLAMMRSAAEF
jgi:pimeloyl-ACP methyl ester carboxylesterase